MSHEPIAAPNSSAPSDPKTERILSASREAFLELGYAATSMDLVAQRARVSKTTLYTRFPSKDDLYVATINAECERRGLRFRSDAFDHLPLEEALYQAGRRFVELIWAPEVVKMHRSVMGEVGRFPDMARLYFEEGAEKAIQSFTALFERLAARGLATIEDAEFTAVQFLAAMDGGQKCALELGVCPPLPSEERDRFVRRAVTLFVRGIRSAPQAAD